MSEFDPTTGEVKTGMPPAVAKGVIGVMKKVRQIGYDDRNDHQKYAFVSVDKFFDVIRPLMAAEGIFDMIDEAEIEVFDRPGRDGTASWMRARYNIWVCHESGEMYGPVSRQIVVAANGPQAFGAAQSYIMKYFLRALFKVPTGDKDADSDEKVDLPSGNSAPAPRPAARPPAEPARASNGNGAIVVGDAEREAARASYNAMSKAIGEASTRAELALVSTKYGADLEKLRSISQVHFEQVRARYDKRLDWILAQEQDPDHVPV
jgi:hypothetical protein